jgi:hypothetical protein
MAEIVFKAKGYLEKTQLDKEGAKHATFEFSVKDAVEIAKLELMGRDLKNHLPVLLEIRVKESLQKVNKDETKPTNKIRKRAFKG